MKQDLKHSTDEGSVVEHYYASGDYFEDADRHSEDADFKATNFLDLFLRLAKRHKLAIQSFADVGCGSGHVTKIIRDGLKSNGFDPLTVKGYDVSPHVQNIKMKGIEFIYEDFCKSDDFVDLVTLFDVIEHVPDPIEFIKLAAQRCKVMALHIPLDHSLNNAIRSKFRILLEDPGHLIFLDNGSALTLLALSGLRVVDYEYTFGFLAPSGHTSLLSKVILPFRYMLAKLSPGLLSKTIGGTSLMVVALTPTGAQEMQLTYD